MEKIAVIEIKTMSVKLQVFDVSHNKYFAPNKVVEMPINLTKDFYSDNFIKTTVIKEINGILTIYKSMIENLECTDIICVVTDMTMEAKNQNGFINEISVTSGLKFSVVEPSEVATLVYTAVINSFNRPKGLIISIGDYNSEIVLYNRRNVLSSLIIPYGCARIFDTCESANFDGTEKKIADEIKSLVESSGIMEQLPEEFDIIGTGDTFKDYGSVCRKAKKYPIEISHNFVSSKADFDKVYNLIKGYGISATTKIKGVTLGNSKYLPCGLMIVKAILDLFNKDEFVISRLGMVEGKLFNEVLPLTLEKPISDTLGYSLQVLNDLYDRKPNNSQHIYELSMILFKQLKVLHKLNRAYVKVLRIASYLSNSGYRIDVENADKAVFDVIRQSEIFGVEHREVIMAGFVAMAKNSDNFNLSEWVRYKEYLTDEDLMAVKKLSVILKIAESLDITGFGNIIDISCDILGDSVIMKTITQSEVTFEIAYTMLCGAEFKKAFNKNLEVL